MATIHSDGGLTADLLHDIDDPFDGPEAAHRSDTPGGQPHFPDAASEPSHEATATGDMEDPFQTYRVATATLSRPSGLIMLPVPLFEATEPPARRPIGWLERAWIIGLSTIIVAASATALREHGFNPGVLRWRARAAALGSQFQPSARAITVKEVGGRSDNRKVSLPAAAPKAALSARVANDAPPLRVERSDALPPQLTPDAVPLRASRELPEVVFASSSRGRSALRARPRDTVAAVHHARTQSALPLNGAQVTEASAVRAHARTQYAARNYAEAAAAYERAAQLDPSHAHTFAGLGAARLQLGQSRAAVQAYERAVQLSPSSIVLNTGLTEAYLRNGNERRARSSCTRLLALAPHHAAAKAACTGL